MLDHNKKKSREEERRARRVVHKMVLMTLMAYNASTRLPYMDFFEQQVEHVNHR
jgi:hypothetical protein